jgi:uncharacterized protein
MKYTLCVTQESNLVRPVGPVSSPPGRMSLTIADQIIDFAYRHTPQRETVDFVFGGGEPFLAFDLVKDITRSLTVHPRYDVRRVRIGLETNGTIFSQEIIEFLHEYDVYLAIQYDGLPAVHDHYWRFPGGAASSPVVEETISRAVRLLPAVVITVAYHAHEVGELPGVMRHLDELGASRISLIPDLSDAWSSDEILELERALVEISGMYIESYRRHRPLLINPLDSKIMTMMQGGYAARRQCRMGDGDYAFTPDGHVFPCARMIGRLDMALHGIGTIASGIRPEQMNMHHKPGVSNPACNACSIKNYCLNWCECINFAATGFYNQVGVFGCSLEKALFRVAHKTIRILEEEGNPMFYERLSCGEAVDR